MKLASSEWRALDVSCCVFALGRRASFADQLKVDELWVPFQKIADRMISPTLLDFYKVTFPVCSRKKHLVHARPFSYLIVAAPVTGALEEESNWDGCAGGVCRVKARSVSIPVSSTAKWLWWCYY